MRKLFCIKKFTLLLLALITISGCGYKPSAQYSRALLGDKISTSVIISGQDPENTVIIKDALNRAVVEVFQASLVSRDVSDTHLIISMGMPSYLPIVYDQNGFVIAYRMTVNLSVLRHNNGIAKNYIAKGHYDFTVAPNAIVTDQERFEAIEFSAQKAIRSFVSKVSAEGARAEK